MLKIRDKRPNVPGHVAGEREPAGFRSRLRGSDTLREPCEVADAADVIVSVLAACRSFKSGLFD